ncbi:MAG: manganese efflux pump [Defluviitaleaceae bacterium]|nr:manganese efflux pump [Defluviitaleaceae bacterium]
MAIFLAIALSVDALGMGISGGLREHKFSWRTYVTLFVVSVLVLAAAELFGNLFANILPDGIAVTVASVWIMVLGVWIVISGFRCKGERAPLISDFQLALVLSLDSLGVGLASASFGIYVFLLPFLVAGFQVVFLAVGYYLAGAFKKLGHRQRVWTILSGLILIAMGLVRLL